MMKATHTLPHGCLPQLTVPISHCCCFLTQACEKRHTDIQKLEDSRQASLSKTNKKQHAYTEKLGSRTTSPELEDTESPQIPWFPQHFCGIITITWLEWPICFISTSLCPTTGSCANPSLAARRRLSHYNPLTVESDIEATLSDVLQVGQYVCIAFPIKLYQSIWQYFVQHNHLRTVGAMLLGKR